MLSAALTYFLFTPTLALLHVANVYFREYRAKRRRAREVLELELVWAMEAREPGNPGRERTI